MIKPPLRLCTRLAFHLRPRVPTPPMAKRAIDPEDLKALNDSFGSEGSSSIRPILVKSSPQKLTTSPVKPQNREFIQDFDTDTFSDFSSDSIIELDQPANEPRTNFSLALEGFQKQKDNDRELRPPSRHTPNQPQKKAAYGKLSDLEGIFDDSDSQSSANATGQTIQISAEETSSPTYHRFETLYPQIPNTAKRRSSLKDEVLVTRDVPPAPENEPTGDPRDAPMLETVPEMIRIETNTAPLSSSTQLGPLISLYPTLHDYEDKYGSVSREEETSFRTQYKKSKSGVPIHPPRSPPNTSSWTKAALQKYNYSGIRPDGTRDYSPDKLAKLEHYAKKFADIMSGRIQYETGKRRRQQQQPPATVSEVNNLLKRPKVNPQLALLTQRPNMGEVRQTRGMATDAHQPKKVQALILSEEQHYVKNLVLDGESIFYTGSAGTGKSILLRELIKSLRDKHGEGSVAVTASTGLAAVNVGGITLHSFAGIGLGKGPDYEVLRKVRRSKKASDRWKSVKVLIIDEVSMISAELFDKLDYIACEIRKNDLPFGGIQIICCGDFFQLPPVSTEYDPATFCFESHSWKRTFNKTLTLKQVFRQQGDMEFIEMLNDMRKGIVTATSLKKFNELARDLPKINVEPTELFSTRAEVERANSYRLKALKAPVHYYQAVDGGSLDNAEQRTRLLSHFMAPEHLELKKDAQVMMIKNIDQSLVNGSLGTVLDFIDRDTYMTYEKVRDEGMEGDSLEGMVDELLGNQNGKELGFTLKDEVKLDTGVVGPLDDEKKEVEALEDTVFDFLRDAKSEDSDQQRSIESKKELMNKLHKSSRGQKLPLVRFSTPDGHIRTILVNPETWSVEDEKQKPLVTRTQLPLMLAWALSIHKSQGQTIPRVRVNLKHVFEKGQAYVAISRAVDREGLQILNFDETKVFAHEKVIEFYSKLQNPSDMKNTNEEEKEDFYSASGTMPEVHDLTMTSPTVARERPSNIDKWKNRYDDMGPPSNEGFDLTNELPHEEFGDLPQFNAVPDFDDTESIMVQAPRRVRSNVLFDMDADGSWDPMSDDSVVGRVASP